MLEEKCGDLLNHKATVKVDGGLQMRFSYSPFLTHSERFADLTRDRNQIHRELQDGETVVPAFLQTVAAMLASKKAMLEHGINHSDFPSSWNKISLDSFVISGLDYELVLTLRDKPLEAYIEIIDFKGKKVFGMVRNFERAEIPEDYERLIHSESFEVGGQVLSNFSQLIGAASPESNLYTMASSSSVIYNAYDAGKLPKMEEGVVPIYSGQEIYLNSGRSIRGEVDVLLGIAELPKGELKRGETLKTMISTWHKGNLINRIASEVTFQSEKLPKLAVKKTLRERNKQS